MADKMGGDILLQVFRVERDEDYQHLMLELVGKQEVNQPTSLLRLANCKRETTCVVALTLQSGKQRCMLFLQLVDLAVVDQTTCLRSMYCAGRFYSEFVLTGCAPPVNFFMDMPQLQTLCQRTRELCRRSVPVEHWTEPWRTRARGALFL